MRNILLHTCCCPCTCYPMEQLINKRYSLTLFYYNPNIQPVDEYSARLNELTKYLKKWPTVRLIEGKYEINKWVELTKGMGGESEGGKRCDICYEMRLYETAELAKKKGFDFFGSTLSISPHKKADKISEIGNRLAKKFGIKFFDCNWKKMNGFKRACKISKKENFYRQDYCGCVYSKKSKVSKSSKASKN